MGPCHGKAVGQYERNMAVAQDGRVHRQFSSRWDLQTCGPISRRASNTFTTEAQAGCVGSTSLAETTGREVQLTPEGYLTPHRFDTRRSSCCAPWNCLVGLGLKTVAPNRFFRTKKSRSLSTAVRFRGSPIITI